MHCPTGSVGFEREVTVGYKGNNTTDCETRSDLNNVVEMLTVQQIEFDRRQTCMTIVLAASQ